MLYKRAFRPQKCEKKCMGSAMDNFGEEANKHLSLEKKLSQAEEFLVDYYHDVENHEPPLMPLEERQAEVKNALEVNGYYKLTRDELVWGARTAWRNAPRCPARVIWKKLIVFDCRQLTDTDMMFFAICRHLEVAFIKSLTKLKHYPGFLEWREHPAGNHSLPRATSRGS